MNAPEHNILMGLAAEWRIAHASLPEPHRRRLKQPGFEIRDIRSVWGAWEGFRKNIVVSRRLILEHSWKSVREVLLHEMAHQIADEVLGGDETPHARRFQEACRMIGADPRASASFPSIYERMAHDMPDDNGRVMARVHKLLAMAQSANRHEAELAMLKAHEAIAKYNVDLGAERSDRAYCSISLGGAASRQTPDRYMLAALLRDYYFVESVWIQTFMPQTGRLGRILEVSGTNENVKMAEYVHSFLNRAIDEQWAAYDAGKERGRLCKADFALGLIEGFREKLEGQDAAAKSSGGRPMALIKAGDQFLKGYLKERYPYLRRVGRSSRRVDRSAHSAGRRAGRSTVLHRPIDSRPSGTIRLLRQFFAACLLGAATCRGGWVEDRAGGTVIHVKVFDLPDPAKTDPFTRSELAGIRTFRDRFPALFEANCKDKYKADPGRYGRHNWDRVEIELERFSGIQMEGVEVDLLAIAGGMAPDVLYVNFRRSDNYIRGGFLHPLDLPADRYYAGMSAAEIAFRVHPAVLPVIDRKGPSGERHVWALPYGGVMGKVLLYRKDLFDGAGLAYPTEAWTWDDFLAAARKLTRPEKGTYGFFLTRHLHDEGYQWLPFLWSAGGEVMTYDAPSDRWTCQFDSAEAATALDFYTRLISEKWTDAGGRLRRGYTSRDAGDFIQKWSRGEIAMMFAYIDEKVFSSINPEVTGMAPLPKGPTGIRAGELNSRMMGLYSGIRDPVIRDAAWEYMRFYDSDEAMRAKTRVLVEGGLGPFLNPVYLRRYGYAEIERLSPRGWSDSFEVAIRTGKPEPCGRNSNLAYSLMSRPIHKAEQMALKEQLPADGPARLAVLRSLLREGCARANEQMMGVVPPRERALRRAVAWCALAAMLATFGLMLRSIARAFRRADAAPGGAARSLRKYRWAAVLLLPACLTVLVWQYIPLGRGTLMAFQDYRLIGHSAWVGVDNFGDVLFDAVWWTAVWNSLRYSFLVVVLTFLPPLGLAVLLQEVPRGRVLYRLLFYMPAVVSGLVTILMWKQFYDVSDRGLLNAVALHIPAAGHIVAGFALLALALGFAARLWRHDMRLAAGGFAIAGAALAAACVSLAWPVLSPPGSSAADVAAGLWRRVFQTPAEPYRWLVDPGTAMFACVLPMVWAGVGPGSLVYLAALKGIPEEYYEAADIDGASFLDKVLFVILPNLKPLLTINFVGAFIGAWYHAAGNILTMTGGGAGTEVADLHIWYKAFTYLKFGPATAMAWMLGFILIGFTMQQMKMLARVEFRAQGEKK